MRRCSALATSSLVALVAACGAASEPPVEAGPRLTISVAALGLGTGISDAVFAMTVRDPSGDPVWSVPELSAARYGGPEGFAYSGPCDPGVTYRIELVLLRLLDRRGEQIPATTWHNPTSPDQPLVREAGCSAETGLPVSFALDLARDSSDGFFDVGVRFDDVFCSAKVDCVDDRGDPLKLLYRGPGVRGETALMSLACTTGSGPTWLFLDQLELACGGAAPIVIDPDGAEGNHGARPPTLFETAIYHGVQVVAGDRVCYWNAALGVDVGPGAASCVLRTRGTAADTQWPSATSPDGHVYPWFDIEVPLTDASGAVVCGHAAASASGPVSLRYTDGVTPETFERTRGCGFETVPFPRDVVCDGTSGGGHEPTFVDLGSGRFDVRFGDDHLAAPLTLPVGRALASCCANPCCGAGP